jgi:hypothetical protein
VSWIDAVPLFATTSWVDVAIPGVGGLLVAIRPNWFIKRSGSAERDSAKEGQLRIVGFILLGVAASYYLVMPG